MFTGLSALASVANATEPRTLARDLDPVVLRGADLPALLGAAPAGLVAWAYRSGWVQVPLQVDERATIDIGQQVYNGMYNAMVVITDYTDPTTFTGPDPDSSFDADDELSLRAADAGDRVDCAAAGEPAGVDPGSGVELEARDPLSGEKGWFYLYRSSTGLDPSAGVPDIDYDFVLLSGPYLTTYHLAAGPNPEQSRVVTPAYTMGFSDRWIRDEVRITAGGASGVNIFDRHRNLFSPTICGRSEDSFTAGEGAFLINKRGPVRAIRAHFGANSGPHTERTHWFYPSRHDVASTLRVHPITGLMDLYDLSSKASGMTYYDDRNLDGAPVDGTPDAVARGPIQWTLVTGAQGTMTSAIWVETDIAGLPTTSYYNDEVVPRTPSCTGDGAEFAASGGWINVGIPNTDGPAAFAKKLIGHRVDYLEPPGGTPALAARRHDQAVNPITATASAYCPACDPAAILPIRQLTGTRLASDVELTWRADLAARDYDAWWVARKQDIAGARAGGNGTAVAGCTATPARACTDPGSVPGAGGTVRYYQLRGACGLSEGRE